MRSTRGIKTNRRAPLSAEQNVETRQKMIDAALKLFLQFGYHNLRIEDITSCAGVGKGTFYLYFENKRDLLLGYLQHVMDRIDAVEDQAAADGLTAGSRVILRMRAALATESTWHKSNTFLRIAANSTDQDISTAAREVHARLVKLGTGDMLAGIGSGQYRDVDAELATHVMVGMQEILAWRAGLDSDYTSEQLFAFVLDVYSRLFSEPAGDAVLRQAGRIASAATRATSESSALALSRAPGEPLDTRRKLIDAAVDLFVEEGYSNLRISDITDHAGVGKGTFYLHFAGKRDLLLAYFERVVELVEAVEAEAASADLDHAARTGLRMSSALDPAGKWNKVMTFLRISSNSDDPEVAAAARAIHLRMLEPEKRDFALAMENGLVRKLDPELAALAWAGMQEVVAWRADQDGSYDKTTIMAFLADTYARAFMTGKEPQ